MFYIHSAPGQRSMFRNFRELLSHWAAQHFSGELSRLVYDKTLPLTPEEEQEAKHCRACCAPSIGWRVDENAGRIYFFGEYAHLNTLAYLRMAPDGFHTVLVATQKKAIIFLDTVFNALPGI